MNEQEAIQFVYETAMYVARTVYSNGEEFVFKNALDAELKNRFAQWKTYPKPTLHTEVVLDYVFPLSDAESDIPCTHLRVDIWIRSSDPKVFPSMVIELKAVDKLQVKHRKQAHQYFCMLRELPQGKPELAVVINFRCAFHGPSCCFQPLAPEEDSESTSAPNAKKRKLSSAGVFEEITDCVVSAVPEICAAVYPPLQPCSLEETQGDLIQFAVGTPIETAGSPVHQMRWKLLRPSADSPLQK